MQSLRSLCLVASILAVAACEASYPRDEIAPPADRYEQFYPAGADQDVREYEDEFSQSNPARIASYRAALTQVPRTRGVNILALSGGGQHGAYGAGVLNGWTASGNRPKFDIVTGISTGALIAPFAFLGPEYDDRIERFYTQSTTRDVVRLDLGGALFGKGFLAKTTPLRAAIERELSDDVINKIAQEHAKGRRLFVGTTNIDAERPVTWDIGAIAMIGTEESRQLIRQVVLASASIPVVFEPVSISVTDGDILREELHVDGGLTREVFAYPHGIEMRKLLSRAGLSGRQNRIWVIHNKKLEAHYAPQAENATAVAQRAFELLIRAQSIGDIERIVEQGARDGLVTNLTWIPVEFDVQPEEAFDKDYMTKLFALGRFAGQQKDAWLYDVSSLY